MSASSELLARLDAAQAAAWRELMPLVADSPTVLGGVTVLAFLQDEHFVIPVSVGPTGEHLAGFEPATRNAVANTLRNLADAWASAPAGTMSTDGRGIDNPASHGPPHDRRGAA
jgi:hypothetical protein